MSIENRRVASLHWWTSSIIQEPRDYECFSVDSCFSASSSEEISLLNEEQPCFSTSYFHFHNLIDEVAKIYRIFISHECSPWRLWGKKSSSQTKDDLFLEFAALRSSIHEFMKEANVKPFFLNLWNKLIFSARNCLPSSVKQDDAFFIKQLGLKIRFTWEVWEVLLSASGLAPCITEITWIVWTEQLLLTIWTSDNLDEQSLALQRTVAEEWLSISSRNISKRSFQYSDIFPDLLPIIERSAIEALLENSFLGALDSLINVENKSNDLEKHVEEILEYVLILDMTFSLFQCQTKDVSANFLYDSCSKWVNSLSRAINSYPTASFSQLAFRVLGAVLWRWIPNIAKLPISQLQDAKVVNNLGTCSKDSVKHIFYHVAKFLNQRQYANGENEDLQETLYDMFDWWRRMNPLDLTIRESILTWLSTQSNKLNQNPVPEVFQEALIKNPIEIFQLFFESTTVILSDNMMPLPSPDNVAINSFRYDESTRWSLEEIPQKEYNPIFKKSMQARDQSSFHNSATFFQLFFPAMYRMWHIIWETLKKSGYGILCESEYSFLWGSILDVALHYQTHENIDSQKREYPCALAHIWMSLIWISNTSLSKTRSDDGGTHENDNKILPWSKECVSSMTLVRSGDIILLIQKQLEGCWLNPTLKRAHDLWAVLLPPLEIFGMDYASGISQDPGRASYFGVENEFATDISLLYGTPCPYFAENMSLGLFLHIDAMNFLNREGWQDNSIRRKAFSQLAGDAGYLSWYTSLNIGKNTLPVILTSAQLDAASRFFLTLLRFLHSSQSDWLEKERISFLKDILERIYFCALRVSQSLHSSSQEFIVSDDISHTRERIKEWFFKRCTLVSSDQFRKFIPRVTDATNHARKRIFLEWSLWQGVPYWSQTATWLSPIPYLRRRLTDLIRLYGDRLPGAVVCWFRKSLENYVSYFDANRKLPQSNSSYEYTEFDEEIISQWKNILDKTTDKVQDHEGIQSFLDFLVEEIIQRSLLSVTDAACAAEFVFQLLLSKMELYEHFSAVLWKDTDSRLQWMKILIRHIGFAINPSRTMTECVGLSCLLSKLFERVILPYAFQTCNVKSQVEGVLDLPFNSVASFSLIEDTVSTVIEAIVSMLNINTLSTDWIALIIRNWCSDIICFLIRGHQTIDEKVTERIQKCNPEKLSNNHPCFLIKTAPISFILGFSHSLSSPSEIANMGDKNFSSSKLHEHDEKRHEKKSDMVQETHKKKGYYSNSHKPPLHRPAEKDANQKDSPVFVKGNSSIELKRQRRRSRSVGSHSKSVDNQKYYRRRYR